MTAYIAAEVRRHPLVAVLIAVLVVGLSRTAVVGTAVDRIAVAVLAVLWAPAVVRWIRRRS